MEKIARILTMQALKECPGNYDGVILGHENCPLFYRQSNIDEMIRFAIEHGLSVEVNIPVLFEQYLQEFKDEAKRLIKEYPQIKLIVNDWGLLWALHKDMPELNFTAGKGISFTYGDNPWNEHILYAEKQKYQQALKSVNMENPDTIAQLIELGVNEIEMSDLENSSSSYENLHNKGFIVTVNKGLRIATMSRACHCLRFTDHVNEMGKCIDYCTKETVLSIKRFYNMAESVHQDISAETKAIQPDMIVHANITMVVDLDHAAKNRSCIDKLVYDERIKKYLSD